MLSKDRTASKDTKIEQSLLPNCCCSLNMRRLVHSLANTQRAATPLHIGIVGCSAEGAALCYRTICLEGHAALQKYQPNTVHPDHAHPEVSMHTPSLSRYTAHLDAGNIPGVASLMLESAHRLHKAGADFLICPDNTIHQAMHLVEPASPLPWLHIATTVAEAAAAADARRVGITGTHWLTHSRVYPDALEAAGLEWRRPPESDIETISTIIMDELVRGVHSPSSVAALQACVERLASDQGCDTVVLGCTELPLVLNDQNCAIPTLDSTTLLARKALQVAASGAVAVDGAKGQ